MLYGAGGEHQKSVASEVMDGPSLELLKNGVDGALRNLV